MKTVKDVMGEDRSDNQVAFAAWLLVEAEAAGLEFKSAAAEDAFKLGAVLGHAMYKLFQTTKPTSVIAQRSMEKVPEVAVPAVASKAKVVVRAAVAKAAPVKATPKPRARKAAAK